MAEPSGKDRRTVRRLAAGTAAALAVIVLGALEGIAPVWQPGYQARGSVQLAAAVSAAGDADPSGPIDLNTATLEQLMELPGIGETRGRAILAYRDAHGPFTDVNQLTEIEGISQRMVDQWGDLVIVP